MNRRVTHRKCFDKWLSHVASKSGILKISTRTFTEFQRERSIEMSIVRLKYWFFLYVNICCTCSSKIFIDLLRTVTICSLKDTVLMRWCPVMWLLSMLPSVYTFLQNVNRLWLPMSLTWLSLTSLKIYKYKLSPFLDPHAFFISAFWDSPILLPVS